MQLPEFLPVRGTGGARAAQQRERSAKPDSSTRHPLRPGARKTEKDGALQKEQNASKCLTTLFRLHSRRQKPRPVVICQNGLFLSSRRLPVAATPAPCTPTDDNNDRWYIVRGSRFNAVPNAGGGYVRANTCARTVNRGWEQPTDRFSHIGYAHVCSVMLRS